MIKRFPYVEKFSLPTRKVVFPYQYITSVEKIHENKLPDPDSFYNKLTLERVSSEDYSHARKVWQTFNITDLGEYSDLSVDGCPPASRYFSKLLLHYHEDPIPVCGGGGLRVMA